MQKRTKKTITLGSGKVYLAVYANSIPSIEELFVDANHLGYIEGGASVEYAQETEEKKDDLGYVSKIITTSEEALMRFGLMTWNGTTLQQLIDRCKTVEKGGLRTTYIGGKGNEQGKYYAVGFFHEDKTDGNLWVRLVGRNTAGATLTFSTSDATLVEPEFKALPMDDNGTLLIIDEQIADTAATSSTGGKVAGAGK